MSSIELGNSVLTLNYFLKLYFMGKTKKKLLSKNCLKKLWFDCYFTWQDWDPFRGTFFDYKNPYRTSIRKIPPTGALLQPILEKMQKSNDLEKQILNIKKLPGYKIDLFNYEASKLSCRVSYVIQGIIIFPDRVRINILGETEGYVRVSPKKLIRTFFYIIFLYEALKNHDKVVKFRMEYRKKFQ